MSAKPLHKLSSKHYLIVILIFLFVLDGFALWITAKLDYDNTLKRARIELEKAAVSLDERVKRTVIATMAILNNRAARIQEIGMAGMVSSVQEWERFRSAAQGLPDVGSLWLLDNKGNLLMDSTEYPSQRMNFSEREYFVPHRDQGVELFIGPVVKGKITKKYSFTISRRINGKDGNFLGIVLAAIDTDDFARFLHILNIAENSTITVFRTDGVMILRQPMQDEYIGKTFKHLKLFSMPLDESPAGVYETTVLDGVKRLIAYQTIQGLPLVSATGVPLESILQEWRFRVKIYSLFAIMAFFALVGLSLLVRMTTTREEHEKASEISEINKALQKEIAERKLAEEELRKSRKDLDRSQEVGHVGWWRLDTRLNSLTWSDENYRIFGIPKETRLTYETFLEAIHPDDRQYVDSRWKACLAGEPYEIEHRLMVGSQIKWVREKAYLEFNDAGELLGGFGISQDITERKQAEEILKKNIERVAIISDTASQLLMSQTPQMIVESLCHRVMEHLDCHAFFNYLVDDVKNCLRLNAYAGIPEDIAKEIRFLDYGVAICGCAARDACRIVAENIPATPDIRTDLVRSFGITAYACHPLFSLGQVIGTLSFGTRSRLTFTEDELSLMKTVAGQVAIAFERVHLLRSERERADEMERRVVERTEELQHAYDKLMQETMERKSLEDQLRHSQKMEAIGTLAGGIAHDFNNILAAIIGFGQMIEEDIPLGKVNIQHAQRVLNAAFRGRELVQQILAFSRKADLARCPVSFFPQAEEAARLLRASIPSTIEIVLDNAATEDTILATPIEIQQIFLNLVTNAALSMQENGGILHISLSDIDLEAGSPLLEAGMAPGAYLQLMIKDTGTGMKPEVMERIFEPFFTTREVGKGTGLGLAVVYGIVKSLHGSIRVESEWGAGSMFLIVLPTVTALVNTEELTSEQSHGNRERVLFIDDEELLVEWGQSLLDRLGYEVYAMNNSTEALAVFSSDPSRFDLVITDQTMPGITGLQLAREFLTIRPDIPIILCSGHSETITPEKVKEAGVKEFLMKPLAKDELAGAIHRVLNKEQEQ